MKSATNEATQEPIDTGVKERLRHVLKVKWDGVMAHMAHDLGFRQPALWKTLSGSQPVSGKLLLLLAEHTDVNVNWLLTGKGAATLAAHAALLNGEGFVHPRLRVATKVLPGPPQEHPKLLSAGEHDPLELALTPSQYWLRVGKDEPIVRHKDHQIRPGDWLLLETDRAHFPPVEAMEGKLVVVPASVTKKGPQLAFVDEEAGDDGRLQADTFNLGIDPTQLDEVLVVRELPDGKLQAFKCWYRKEQPGEGSRRPRSQKPMHPDELLYNSLTVKYEDILAVCVLSVRSR